MLTLHERDRDMTVWWATEVECVSAIARLERESGTPGDWIGLAHERLDVLGRAWVEVDPSARLREAARRLLRVHPLRAGDALQLAAAVVASEGRSRTLGFVCLDDRLAGAARREGFRVVEVG